MPGTLHVTHSQVDVKLTVVGHAADDVDQGTEQTAPRGSIPEGGQNTHTAYCLKTARNWNNHNSHAVVHFFDKKRSTLTFCVF